MMTAGPDFYPAAEVATDLRFLDHDGFLAARRDGVGSSDVAVLTGDLVRYATPLTLWEDKRSTGPVDEQTNEAAEWGHRLEPIIAEVFAERFGADLVDVPFILASKTTPWHRASPDYGIVNRGRAELVEIKLRRNPWTDGPPRSIVDQCQWQMHVTGIEKCHVAVLFAGQEMPPPFSIMYDPARAAVLAALADRFWSHVLLGEAPPPMADDTRRIIPGPGEVLLTDAQVSALVEREQLKEQAKELLAAADALADPIKVAMADVERAVDINGDTVATYKLGKKARTFLGKVAA